MTRTCKTIHPGPAKQFLVAVRVRKLKTEEKKKNNKGYGREIPGFGPDVR